MKPNPFSDGAHVTANHPLPLARVGQDNRDGAQAALNNREDRLRAALQAAHMGTWLWDIRHNRHMPDESLQRMMNITEPVLSFAGFLAHVHEPDRARVEAAFMHSVRTGARLNVDFRARQMDGTMIWLRDQGELVRGADGAPDVLTGACMDITALRATETELRDSEERYRLAIEAMQGSIYEMDVVTGQVRGNARLLELLGIDPAPARLSLDAWLARIHPKDRARFASALDEDTYLRGDDRLEIEYRVRHHDREWLWLWQRSIALRDEGGRLLRLVGSVLDVTARHEAQAALRHSEEELRMSEERLRLTLESVIDYAIFTMDLDGRIDSWNVGAERTFGYTVDEAIGNHSAMIFTPEDRAAGVPEEEMRTAARCGRAADERWHLRKDGSRFYVSGVMAPLRRAEAITGYAKIARDLTTQRAAEDALRKAHQELEVHVTERTRELASANASLRLEIEERHRTENARRALLRELVNAQEDERRRVSRDLHDQLGQQLSVLGLKLSFLKQRGAGDPHLAAELDGLASLIKQLDADLDFLVWQLRPTALDDLGLADALADYVDGWSHHMHVPVDVQLAELDDANIPPDIGTVLYRVAQECLTNVAKHARATRVVLQLRREHDAVRLTVRDDGAGFAVSDGAQATRRGLGIVGMRERARLVGGSVVIDSAPGAGTTISVTVPLTPSTDARDERSREGTRP